MTVAGHVGCYPVPMTRSSNTRVAIVGGGITGLATASWLAADHGIDDVVVVEASSRPGGKIRSETDRGHVLEWGPQGFLDNSPDTTELAELAGLAEDVVQADDAAAARFIVRNGRLRPVPTSPPAFITSDILPLAGRLRLLAEPFARGPGGPDETVFDFARRRIGRRAAEVLVDAMVTGIFAGDSRQLALAATFPKMAAMEAEHGSLSRALVAKVREARRRGERSSGPAGPGGRLTSFRRGMWQLPESLGSSLGDRLLLGTRVDALRRDGERFILTMGDERVTADAVLLATPAEVSARLLETLAPSAVDPLIGIPSVPIAVVMTAYRDAEAFGHPVDGFGFLVPGVEKLGILGTLYCHDIFKAHAPEGGLFLRTMIGGARDPGALDLDDSGLVDRTRVALQRVLGGDPDPDGVWVVRWAEGISQYTVGHLDRVRAAEAAAAAVDVELAGSPYRGVSVNDCIKQARAAARRLAGRVGSESA